MTIWLKIDVQGDLQPIAAKARGKVARVYTKYNEDLFITSLREGLHGDITLHYDGWAFDIRFPRHTTVTIIVEEIKSILGPDFDVIVESDHIHVEYDPEIVQKLNELDLLC